MENPSESSWGILKTHSYPTSEPPSRAKPILSEFFVAKTSSLEQSKQNPATSVNFTGWFVGIPLLDYYDLQDMKIMKGR